MWAIVTLRVKYFLLHIPFIYFVSCTRSDNTLKCVFNATLIFFITQRWNVRSLAHLFAHISLHHIFPIHICLYLSLSLSTLLLLPRQRCCRHTHWVYIRTWRWIDASNNREKEMKKEKWKKKHRDCEWERERKWLRKKSGLFALYCVCLHFFFPC